MNEHSLRGLLHRAAHRIPGVPAHSEQPAGHQGTAANPHLSLNHRWNHSPGRSPRFLPAWQRRIAALVNRRPR
jgi:hypothetical protein